MKKYFFILLFIFNLFIFAMPVYASETKDNNHLIKTLVEFSKAKDVIDNSTIDFSDKTIACLGDSITYGANSGSDDVSVTYEDIIKKRLNAKEVLNFGIGGSTIGDYWSDPMCLRYVEIPKDVDIIIVFGGINDCFCCDEEEFGNLKDLEEETFCGDLNRLMKGLQESYSESEVFFVTPLETVMCDILRNDGEHGYILDQKLYSDAIIILAKQYGFNVIDLYNTKILSTYDSRIVKLYVEDNVHPNDWGYNILGTILAKEIILANK